MLYAIYQSGYKIFGVGPTPDAAWQNAQSWLAQDEALPPVATSSREVVGALMCRRCTATLATMVANRGGDVEYTILKDGVLDILEY